jgi:UDPglucose 6-dehydrogenase
VNVRQKQRMLQKLERAFAGTLDGRTVAVWGLAFKAETDDMRESPSINLVEGIRAGGGRVQAYDPHAEARARDLFGTERVVYADGAYDALKGADALCIVTEWLEFRNPDFKRMKSLLARPLIVDGRNLYDPKKMTELGFTYIGIGRGQVV